MLFIPGFLKKSRVRNKKRTSSPETSTGRLMLALEPRYLYDAAGLIAGLDVFDPPDTDGAGLAGFDIPDGLPVDPVPPAALAPTEIVFVDPSVKDPDTLANGISEDALVIRLNGNEDGVSQIGAVLGSYENIQAVHILTHGSSGSLQLGSTVLSADSIDAQAEALRAWGEGLADGADILVYGCNVASGDSGQAFTAELADLTGADVAASDDPTGSESLGGDWNLEYLAGNIETGIGISSEAQGMYAGLLATYTVDIATDEQDGNYTAGDLSLREAITLANANLGTDYIQFNYAALNGQTINLNSQLPTITDALVIDNDLDDNGVADANFAIDGQGNYRVFHNQATTVFDGLTIQNGYTANDGGGIYNSGDLTIQDSAITGNYAEFDGGGIYNSGNLTIQNSTLSHNTADYGGGIYNYYGSVYVENGSHVDYNTAYDDGGGIYNDGGDVHIRNYSHVDYNTAADGDGGGIYNYYGSVYVENGSHVDYNTAYDDGGGIYNDGYVFIDNGSHVDYNTAYDDGGGIYNSGNLTIDSSYINENYAYYWGGGICNNGYAWLRNSSHVDYNEAAAGGGIENWYYLYVYDSYINYNSAYGNGYGGYGGGIDNWEGYAWLDNTHVDHNYAEYDGGGIYNYYGYLYIDNGSHVDYNTAADGDGGGIYNDYGYVYVTHNSHVDYNYAYEDGGGIFNAGYAYYSGLKLTGMIQDHAPEDGGPIGMIQHDALEEGGILDDFGFILPNGGGHDGRGGITGNGGNEDLGASRHDHGGGHEDGIYKGGDRNIPYGTSTALPAGMGGEGSVFIDYGSHVDHNEAYYGDGGGIFNDGGYVFIDNGSHVDYNTAGGYFYDSYFYGGSGGGIFNDYGNVYVDNASHVDYNTAQYNGGGIYNDGGYLYAGNGSHVDYNTASGYYYDDDYYGGSGGGIFSDYGEVHVTIGSHVDYNTAYLHGGGIYNYGGGVYIYDSAVSHNISHMAGGGIATFYGGQTHIYYSAIDDNTAYIGGGLANVFFGSADIVQGTVSGNMAYVFGGGVANFIYGASTFDHSTIDGNSTYKYGGGILNIAGQSGLYASTVSNNTALTGGGIMSLSLGSGFPPSMIDLANSTVSGNTDTGGLGGIVNYGSADIYHSTITANSGYGLYNQAGTVNTGHTIFDGDVGGDYAITSQGYNLFTQYAVTGAVGSDLLYAYAGLGPLADNGGPTLTHALGIYSDALDAGDPAAVAGSYGIPAYDQRGLGFARVSGIIDIGAVENQNQIPTAYADAFATDEDTAFTTGNVLINDIDPDTSDTLSVSALDATGALGTVTDNGDGTFTYDPNGQFDYLAMGETATDTFTYTVSDGNGGTATATVTITVNGVNDPPTAADDAFATDEDTAFTTGNVLMNDTDPDATDTLSVIALDATGTKGLVTNNGDGTFNYDPNGQFDDLDEGETATDTFTYTVSDGNGGTDTATVTITVNGVGSPVVPPGPGPGPVVPRINNIPDAVDDNFSTNADTSLTVPANGLLANDTDPDHSDVLIVESAGAISSLGATVSVNADGSFTYDPTDVAAFQALVEGETLTDTFTYTVFDGHEWNHEGRDTATVTVTVKGVGAVNQPPDAVDDSGNANAVLSVNASNGLLGNDSDPDGDPIAITASDAVSSLGATVTINPDGSYTYDPTDVLADMAPGDTLEDTFTYTISDGRGGFDTATVTITLTVPDAPEVNRPPVAVGDAGDADPENPVIVGTAGALLGNDSDPDGDALSISDYDAASALGATVTVNPDGGYTYDAASVLAGMAPGETREDAFTYTISDGRGGFDTATVAITLTVPDEIPDDDGDGGSDDGGDDRSGWNMGRLFQGFGRLGGGGFGAIFRFNDNGGTGGSGNGNAGPLAKRVLFDAGPDSVRDMAPFARSVSSERLLDNLNNLNDVRKILNEGDLVQPGDLGEIPDDVDGQTDALTPEPGFADQVRIAASSFDRERDAFLEALGIAV